MPRPEREDADYFIHEKGLRDKPELKSIRRNFGIEGYAIYNMILEILIDSPGIQFELNELRYDLLAGDFQMEIDKLKEIIEYMVQLKLFHIVNGMLRSEYLDNKLSGLWKKRKSNLEDIRAKAMIVDGLPTVSGELSEVSDSETIPKSPDNPYSKGKSSKERKVENQVNQNKVTEDQEISEGDMSSLREAYLELEETLGETGNPINFNYEPRFHRLCKQHGVDMIWKAIESLSESAGEGISAFEDIIISLTQGREHATPISGRVS